MLFIDNIIQQLTRNLDCESESSSNDEYYLQFKHSALSLHIPYKCQRKHWILCQRSQKGKCFNYSAIIKSLRVSVLFHRLVSVSNVKCFWQLTRASLTTYIWLHVSFPDVDHGSHCHTIKSQFLHVENVVGFPYIYMNTKRSVASCEWLCNMNIPGCFMISMNLLLFNLSLQEKNPKDKKIAGNLFQEKNGLS